MKEFWDLLNVNSNSFRCARAAYNVAKGIARKQDSAIMVRHHGPRPSPNNDPTRVNHYVWPNGQRDYKRNKQTGEFEDVG